MNETSLILPLFFLCSRIKDKKIISIGLLLS